MKGFYLVGLILLTTVSAYAQVEREKNFKDFRGHQLRQFDREEFRKSVARTSVRSENSTRLIHYPNPSSSKLYIESEMARSVDVSDGEGLILATLDLRAGRTELDVSAYESGVYYMRQTADRKLLAKILVTK